MKILMVCLGNICRSPLAHGIFEHVVNEKKLGWTVDSAGTGDWHIGNPPDHRSVAVARKNNIDISQQRAQHFTGDLFDQFDKIFVMDRQNYKDVIRLAKSQDQIDKVSLFLDDDVVPDPYYDDALFEPVYRLVYDRCVELVDELSK